MDIGALKPADRNARGRGRDVSAPLGNYKQPLTSERLFGMARERCFRPAAADEEDQNRRLARSTAKGRCSVSGPRKGARSL